MLYKNRLHNPPIISYSFSSWGVSCPRHKHTDTLLEEGYVYLCIFSDHLFIYFGDDPTFMLLLWFELHPPNNVIRLHFPQRTKIWHGVKFLFLLFCQHFLRLSSCSQSKWILIVTHSAHFELVVLIVVIFSLPGKKLKITRLMESLKRFKCVV